ncbi:SdrD B-like domain-containing protein [Kiritimatiellaeota bacterium B1221]|nr:SdrD B-like domain-containing protein [Kiritimatiellaeota bacterium B1221]
MKKLLNRFFVFGALLTGFLTSAQADVEVFKSIKGGLTEVDAGETFSYSLQYRAASTTTDFFNATLTDDLPEGLEFVGLVGTVHTDSFTHNNGLVTVNFVDPLPAGSTGDIELKVRFKKGSTLDGATAVNTATIDADNSPASTSDPVTITARAEDQSSASKILLGSSIPLDQNVTYRVSLDSGSSIGGLDLSDITMVDTLPAGAVYVDSSNGGVYDSLAHTVTWTATSLAAGSTLNRTVTVVFPSATYVIGDDVTNNLSVTYTPVGGTPETIEPPVPPTHEIEAPNGAHVFSKSVANNYTYEGKEVAKTWSFSLQNKGNVPMDNVVVTDEIPIEVDVTRIYVGQLSGTPAGFNDPVSTYYKTNLNGSWTALPGNPYAGTANQSVTVSSLGLGASEYVTAIKWDFGTIPVGYKVNNLKFNSTILTSDRNGDPVLEGQKIINVADLSYEDYRGPQTDHDDATITVRSPRPVIKLAKAASPTTVNDGETTTYTLTFQNDGLAHQALINPEFADFLDAKLEYVNGSYQVVSKPAGAPDPIFEVENDYKGSGRTLLRWKWSGASAYSLPVGQEFKVSFDALIPAGTIYGGINNEVAATGWDNPVVDSRSVTKKDDVDDLDNDGNTTEDIYTKNKTITVRGRASMDSVKWVKGELDAAWSKYPDSGRTVPGGAADYRLIVKNTGNVPIYDAVVLDILPVIGDTGVIDLSQRDTEWVAALAGPVVAPAGVTVYYSRRSDPTRPDFDSDGPVGSLPPEWSATPPATITDARALLFVFDSVTIQPAEEFELTWPMRAPVGTPTGGEIAWNSFGYYGTREDTDTNLLPSEPIKVGIGIEPDNNASYGDRVWYDDNRDGIQDLGEEGVNGILVYLYEDSGPGLFGDGIADPSTDRLVGFTVTADNYLGEPGYYLFSELDRGDYYAVFDLPDTYIVSPAHQGVDDAIDSDVVFDSSLPTPVWITPITEIEAMEDDRTWDAGIWLPPADVEIVKTAGTAADGDDFWINPNTPVTYTYTVTNTGDLPLVRIRVTDDKLGQVALLDGPIAPGDSVTVTKTSPALSSGVVNIGDVEAYPADPDTGLEIAGGKPVVDDDPATVRVYASIGDYVWYDQDMDGVQDSGEPPVKGVLVTLYDLNGDPITTQTTGNNGKYKFTSLLPGTYSVGFDLPAGYTISTQDAGSNDAKDSDADKTTGKTIQTVLVEEEADMTWDLGLWKHASLGDYVWNDENKNGIQDASESGINGATVHLLDGAGNPVLDASGDAITTVTANGPGGAGYYRFDGLTPGTPYRVKFDPVVGYVFTTQNADAAGIDGADNSDAHPDTGLTAAVTLVNEEHNPRIDAGIFLGDPEIALIKNVDKSEYSVDGEVLTYSFTVTNTGNVPLINVKVTDPLFTVQGGPISLVPGETDSTTFSGTYNVDLADLNAGQRDNTAKVVGTWEYTGEVVEDTDDVTVPANQMPELTLTKTGTYRSSLGPCDTLGMGKHFNALVFGNFDAIGGDTDGRLAVGGNSNTPSAYSVGIPIKGDAIAPIIGSDTDMYIVGGDLNDGVWGVNGNVVFGGTRTGDYRYQVNGNVTRQVIPVTFDSNGNVPADGSGITFAELRAEMEARSALFGALDDQGVVSIDDSVPYMLTLTGNDPNLNVFNVTAAQWSVTSSNINIEVPNGSTVLVNIHGTPVSIVNGGMVLSGTSSRTTLFNYVDATEISTSGFTHLGSVLAPYADGDFSGGGIDGTAVFGGDVKTRNGFEFHNFPFSGNVCVEVFYEFTVANVGNVTITDIQIDDPVVDVIGGPINLDPGFDDEATFTAIYKIQPEDILSGSFTNTAVASGQPPLGKPRVTTDASDTQTFSIPGIGSGGGAGAGGAGASGGAGGGAGVVPAPGTPAAWEKADFAITAIELLPVPDSVGDSFTVKVSVTNSGSFDGDAGNMRLWLVSSADAPAGAGDRSIPLGTMTMGESRVVTFGGLTAPATAGTYKVVVIADADGITDESTEGNNTLAEYFTLADPSAGAPEAWMKPDFIVQSVELLPSPTITSTRYSVRVRIKNEGDIAGDAGTLKFWASSPSYVNLPASADETQALGVIAAGATVEVVFNDLIAPAVQGTYHSRVIVDANDVTDEYSNGNNQGGSTYTVFPLTIEVSSEVDGYHISWNSAAGFTYTVERATSLGGTFTPIATDVPATAPKNTYIDDSAPAGMIFYRVWGVRP